MPNAEFDHIGQTADQVRLLVLLLCLGQNRIETLQVVLPVLREELTHCLLLEKLLHKSCLLYVFTLHLLSWWHLFWLLLALLLRLRFEAVAAESRNHSFIVIFARFLWGLANGPGLCQFVFVGDFGVGKTAVIFHLSLHELIVVLVLNGLSELIFFIRTRGLFFLGVVFEDVPDVCFDLLYVFLDEFGLIEILPFDCPRDEGPLLPQLFCQHVDLHDGVPILLCLIVVLVLDGLLLIGTQFRLEFADILLVFFVSSLLAAHLLSGWLVEKCIWLF